ncbi:ATP-binding protein [Micromonospora endolithica]|uniref:ATPase n=1 Tax=Micromonospora endolithica TaxID=230091 RepID=A0A3A9ZMQ0_9ACTN|nr:AAA family ATPase [Micromonospora endolithica]RKN49568.1 ATPase [Micromonospora endolithica]TWJ23787.1 AAA ATPase-like protein [Micromonospora endolithica]
MEPRRGEALIGREHPAALLRAEVDRVLDSHGGLVLVTGEPGIGKTTLVTAAAEEARRRGALVLGAACWDSDNAPGYWPWVQVIRGLRRSADDWAVAREVAEPALAMLLGETSGPDADGKPTADDDAEREAFALYDAVTTALVAVSQRRPVVVVLDDLHWADPASVRLLRFAAQHTWFERLLLLGTYRDAEVELTDHPLAPLLVPLTAKATTVTLTGMSRDEVSALVARTAGREPDGDLVDEMHRRTGGNPFFVEQAARLWHAGGPVDQVAPGVREVVRQRLAQLPAPVVDTLTVAAVLGREFHRGLLAATVGRPAAQVDRDLDRAVTARLVLDRGAGRSAFVHDLVRETLYDGLPVADRRARHAAVVRAVDTSTVLAEQLVPADLARHAWLGVPDLPPGRVADLLVVAAREASRRMALEEAAEHLRRAGTVVTDPGQRVRIMVELAALLHHAGRRDEAGRLLAEAEPLALALDDPAVLARVALMVHRHHWTPAGQSDDAEAMLREAHRRLVGVPDEVPSLPTVVTDLVTVTEKLARRGADDEALTFSLWTLHDTTWGMGTAGERAAITAEIRDVARRAGDEETVLWATSLRWVALLELGDPGYLAEWAAFVRGTAESGAARHRMAGAIDGGIVNAFRGDFAAAGVSFDEVGRQDCWPEGEHGFLGQHVRWSWLVLQGRIAEGDALLDGLGPDDYPYVALLRGINAVERGDHAEAVRLVAEIEAAGVAYPRPVSPLWLRLAAQVAAASGDPVRGGRVRAELAPYRGQWLVALFGCDLSGPVDHWIAAVDAAGRRWDEAVAGFAAARDAADRMGSRPWSVLARAGLVEALTGRDGPGDRSEAATIRAEVLRDARELGMAQVRARLGDTGPPPAAETPAPPEVDTGQPAYAFRRDGPVWELAWDGTVVHLPDAKGLHDLRLLLARPGVDVPTVELLDPAAGPELVAARRLGGDPVLDDEAKARYRRHLERLDDEIDRAAGRDDLRRVAALDAERAALLHELRAAAGLAGRTRRLGDEAERARKAVTARIRDTLRRIDGRHPALAAHLRDSVSTGSSCRYQPAAPVPWRL